MESKAKKSFSVCVHDYTFSFHFSTILRTEKGHISSLLRRWDMQIRTRIPSFLDVTRSINILVRPSHSLNKTVINQETSTAGFSQVSIWWGFLCMSMQRDVTDAKDTNHKLFLLPELFPLRMSNGRNRPRALGSTLRWLRCTFRRAHALKITSADNLTSLHDVTEHQLWCVIVKWWYSC